MVEVEEAEVMKEVEDLDPEDLDPGDLDPGDLDPEDLDLEALHGNCRDIGRLYAINFFMFSVITRMKVHMYPEFLWCFFRRKFCNITLFYGEGKASLLIQCAA
jgi:hypothetical protein